MALADVNLYQKYIKQNYGLLRRTIDPTTEVLGRLSMIDSIRDDIKLIENDSIIINKLLLDILPDAHPNVKDEIIAAFDDSNQEHVANILKNDANGEKQPMTIEHYKCFSCKNADLRQFIDPEGRLLSELLTRNVFSADDEIRVNHRGTTDDKASEIVRIMQRKWDGAFGEFIDALNATQQGHIAWILTGIGNERPMRRQYIKILNKRRILLRDHLEPERCGLLDSLLSSGTFNDSDIQRISAEKKQSHRYGQALLLVDMLKRKADSAFRKFLEALEQTDQKHIVESVFGVVVNGFINIISEQDVPSLEDEVKSLLQHDLIANPSECGNSLLDLFEFIGTTVETIASGSIAISFRCFGEDSLSAFHQLHMQGKINRLLNRVYKSKISADGFVSLSLKIEPGEFRSAEQKLASCKLMTLKHQTALKSLPDELIDSFVVTDAVLDDLMLDVALCRLCRKAVEAQSDDRVRTKLLLDILSRKSEATYSNFIEILRSAKQESIIEFLEHHSLVFEETKPSDDLCEINESSSISLIYDVFEEHMRTKNRLTEVQRENLMLKVKLTLGLKITCKNKPMTNNRGNENSPGRRTRRVASESSIRVPPESGHEFEMNLGLLAFHQESEAFSTDPPPHFDEFFREIIRMDIEQGCQLARSSELLYG